MKSARAAEFRDDDAGQHILRVGRYAAIIAQSMGMTPKYDWHAPQNLMPELCRSISQDWRQDFQ